jgi:hypothetical protein
MTNFVEGKLYKYIGNKKHPRQGASSETGFRCVAEGKEYSLLYWDGRVCGMKETTVAVKQGAKDWEEKLVG